MATTGAKSKRFGVRYPWVKWFARARSGPLTLVKGMDFQCYPHGMNQNLRAAARKYLGEGETLSVTIREHTVVIQVLRRSAA